MKPRPSPERGHVDSAVTGAPLLYTRVASRQSVGLMPSCSSSGPRRCRLLDPRAREAMGGRWGPIARQRARHVDSTSTRRTWSARSVGCASRRAAAGATGARPNTRAPADTGGRRRRAPRSGPAMCNNDQGRSDSGHGASIGRVDSTAAIPTGHGTYGCAAGAYESQIRQLTQGIADTLVQISARWKLFGRGAGGEQTGAPNAR